MKNMNYSDEYLQNHELNYWIYGHKLPFHHEKFYKDFFPFDKLSSGLILEIGCGGCPISEYNNIDCIDRLTLLDPLIENLSNIEKFKFLNKYKKFSDNILHSNIDDNFDFIICLNVIDHFNDPDYNFVDKIFNLLNDDGEFWIYYDLRTHSSDDHLMIDNNKLFDKFKKYFNIIKISEDINPTHEGWSNVCKSIRLILRKK